MIDAGPSLQAAERLTASALAAYLRSTGWAARLSRVRGVTIFSKTLPDADAPVQVIVPEATGFSDEEQLIAGALRTLEAIEERSLASIAKDVQVRKIA